MNYSPLRYPGGKSKLYNVVKSLITSCNEEIVTYVEPFAGGAGIALGLLMNNDVENIVINDINKGVYSFWKAVCESSDDLIKLIVETPVDMDNYRKQKALQTKLKKENKYSVDYGFNTFYLNRANFSGILDAGPIGSYEQKGDYKLDARFNKDELISKIEKISQKKKNIKVYNKDIISFNDRYIPSHSNTFIYFDPPYYVKGQKLYTNFLQPKDHQKIHDSIMNVNNPWLLTYDNVDEIAKIYEDKEAYEFNLSYTVNSLVNRKGTELMYASNGITLDKIPESVRTKINLKKRCIYE